MQSIRNLSTSGHLKFWANGIDRSIDYVDIKPATIDGGKGIMITGRSRANTKAGTYELLIRLPLVMEMIVMSGIMTEIRPGMEKLQKALREIHEPPESRGLDSVCRLAEQLRKIPIQPDLTENIRLIAENIIVAAGIARGDLAKAKRKFEKEIRRKSDGDDHGQYGDLT